MLLMDGSMLMEGLKIYTRELMAGWMSCWWGVIAVFNPSVMVVTCVELGLDNSRFGLV